MRFMVINSTLPSPPPPKQKGKKEKKNTNIRFFMLQAYLTFIF